MGFFQSVDIKATGKLAFKGDKEVAFKSESSVVYSAGIENRVLSKWLVRVVVILSIIVAIVGEVLAIQKLKTEHKFLWYGHAGLSRILSWLFSAIQREYIKIELAETVRDAKARADADAKLQADTERDNAIDVALNSVRDALNLNAAVAVAMANTAAEAAAAAQAKANEIDALTKSISERTAALDSTLAEFDDRLGKNSQLVGKLHQMVETHLKDKEKTRHSASKAAAN